MSAEETTIGSSSNSSSNKCKPLSSVRASMHKLIFGRRRRRRSKPGAALTKCTSTSSINAFITRDHLTSSSSMVDLPIAVWMNCIFPLLDRASQNCLARAHPEVAVARHESYNNNNTPPFSTFPMQWPSGTLSKKLSRPVKRVVFSPDDCTLLVAYCKSNGGGVAQYDKLAGRRGPTNKNATSSSLLLFDPRYSHAGIVIDLQFSPCGTILATAGRNDGTIRLWREREAKAHDEPSSNNNNNHRYTCIRILQVHQVNLRHMIWSRPGDKIVSWGNDGFLRISDTSTGALLHSRFWKTRMEVHGCHLCVAFDPTGRTVAFAHNHDVVCVWDYMGTNESQVIPNVRDEYGTYAGDFVTGLTYSPDGRWLVVGCRMALVKFWHVVLPSSTSSEEGSGSIRHHDDHTNQPLAEYTFDKEIHVGSGWSAVTLLTFTPDSRYLACTNSGSQIRIISVTTNEVLATLTGHCGPIESLAFSANGKTLASGSCDRTVRLWDCSLWCCRRRSSE